MIEAELLKALPGIRHGFFTREGGVSGGIYATRNCGLGSGDDRAAVLENRARTTADLGVEPDRLITPRQAHTMNVAVAVEPWHVDEPPKADAVVTRSPGLAVGVLAADCAPVLLADAKAGVVGAAHAGWRGALSGVLEAAITEMTALGARRENIHAAVGPTISADVYEVGDEFQAAFLEQAPDNDAFFHKPGGSGRAHFDLPGYVCQRLRAAGLTHVGDLALCTFQNESLFFSYRRARQNQEPDYGRQISAILIL
ncbi:MAG: peptidoglycan editing factor PgeF [Dichotomicrobium sp.]